MRPVRGSIRLGWSLCAAAFLTGVGAGWAGAQVQAPVQAPVRGVERIRLGPGGARPPAIADASFYLDEARLRLARLLPGAQGTAAARVTGQQPRYQVGDTEEFWAIDFSRGLSFPYKQYKVVAECRSVSQNAYYFVELEQKTVATDEVVMEFSVAFEDSTPGSPRDPSKGIYQHVTEVFGDVPDVDGDPRIVVLLTDIPDAASISSGDATFAGYFYSANQMADPVNFGGGIKQRSNFTELLYVDAQLLAFDDPQDPGLSAAIRNLVKSTIAHEFQHLVHYGSDPDEITSVNEGMAEYASYLTGFGIRSIARYVSRPNVDLFSWQQYGEVLDDYSRMALWTFYLGQRFGDDFIRALAANALNGEAGVSAALASPPFNTTFDRVYNEFLTALYLDDPTEGSGEFAVDPLDPWVEPAIHENLYPSSYPVVLEPHGALVLRYWNATAGLDIELPDGLPPGVTASLAALGGGGGDVQTLTSAGIVVPGLGAAYREAAVVLTNAAGSRTPPFRIEAAAAQGDTGLVRYENGRPTTRIDMTQSWLAGLRVEPEVVPARITGLWYYLLGNARTEVSVRMMAANVAQPGTWIVNETPLYTATVDPPFSNEGWLYVPLPDLVFIDDPEVDYLISIRASDNSLGYNDITRHDPNRLQSVRSFVRRTTVWEPLVLFQTSTGQSLAGDWMFRAEFAYRDTTAPSVALGLLQHPIFPERADVYVAGDEPLHPGSSTGTLTPPGGSAIGLAFERTLGLFGLRGPAPALLSNGTVSISVEAYDRYGGLSDTVALDVGVARIAPGEGVTLFTAGTGAAVGLKVPAGDHDGSLLTLIAYDTVPEGLPSAPAETGSVLGAPIVSVGPAGWSGPSGGAELRLPISGPGGNDRAVHLERWDGSRWMALPSGVATGGGFAVGAIPGGGWYRLAEGAAAGLPAGRGGVELLGNAPNPFNPETRIRFRIPPERAGSTVKLLVLNVRGQRVRTLVDRVMGAGLHEITWDGRNDEGRPAASGIYLYRLEVGNTILGRKMLLLR